MKTFIWSALAASAAASYTNYLQETGYVFLDADHLGYKTGVTQTTTDEGFKLSAEFYHTRNDGGTFFLKQCLALYVPAPVNLHYYHWGIVFKPREPIEEKKLDGLQFDFKNQDFGWSTTTVNTSDLWIDIANTFDTNTNGVKSNYVTRDTTNDWTLSYTDLSCESGNTKCWFEACGEKLFRTEDAQDWQLNQSYMQEFSAQMYFYTYYDVYDGWGGVSNNPTGTQFMS